MEFHFEEDAMIDNTEVNICNKHRFTAQDCMTTLDYPDTIRALLDERDALGAENARLREGKEK